MAVRSNPLFDQRRYLRIITRNFCIMDTQAFLTSEKFEELKKELDHLKTVRRKEVAESLE